MPKINSSTLGVDEHRPGMRLLGGGTFLMGSEKFYEDERPVRSETVGPFWIDEVPVTNADFLRFTSDTGYVTFAERPPNATDYPGMPEDKLKPGSLVFVPPCHPVDVNGPQVWWHYVLGADWRHPMGPESGLEGLGDHPVVHVVLEDCQAYSVWAGKDLPTEKEWEYAARGGLDGLDYAWGDSFEPNGQSMAKTFRGKFPYRNDAPFGLERTSPVRTYSANAFGLYDMIGNVWEWTSDIYSTTNINKITCCGASSRGSELSSRLLQSERNVLKGGSHLCAPSYCQRYRPAARWGQAIDTSTSHVGFRCVSR